MRVAFYFALIYQAALTLVNKFDWVFDGQNMLPLRLVKVINEGGKCGGLTRAGRPRYDYQASWRFGNSFENRSEA